MDITPRVLAEDLSMCEGDPIAAEAEQLLTQNKLCDKCDFAAGNEEELEKHCVEYHPQPRTTLDESSQEPPPVVKPIPLYKCNSCSFATITTNELQIHKNDVQRKILLMPNPHLFMLKKIMKVVLPQHAMLKKVGKNILSKYSLFLSVMNVLS